MAGFCPSTCPCWPSSVPFSDLEMEVLRSVMMYGAQPSPTMLASTLRYIDKCAGAIGKHRLRYILSVPVLLHGGRSVKLVDHCRTLLACVVRAGHVLGVRAVLQYRVCLETGQHGYQRGWCFERDGSSHPGRHALAEFLFRKSLWDQVWDDLCGNGTPLTLADRDERSARELKRLLLLAGAQPGECCAQHVHDEWRRWHAPARSMRRQWVCITFGP